MKVKEFADALNMSAAVLSPAVAADLRALGDLFASSPSPTVAATLTRLSKATLAPPTIGITVGEALGAIAPMYDFVKHYGKPSLARDFEAVIAFLGRFSQAGVRPFVDEARAALSKPAGKQKPTMREDVVQRHLRHLEQTLGNDPAFTAAYHGLERDPQVGKLEIAELARRFTGHAAKSRPVALKRIWARHHSLMTFKAKSESRDGRSAA
jgi:hypothetical protein